MTEPKYPSISFNDPGGELKARIRRLIGDSSVSVSDFARTAIEDRVDEMEEAETRIEQERAARIKVSGKICPKALDQFASAMARRVILAQG